MLCVQYIDYYNSIYSKTDFDNFLYFIKKFTLVSRLLLFTWLGIFLLLLDGISLHTMMQNVSSMTTLQTSS